ncbi:MAG: prepilin-type N-terminal cleavage/methylation domain-containing protein [Tissierellia bacterium]|nr:prepilin-type N-terminal cleavage/methylation domain-containing protein [Tissierellia bacterium]
MYIFKRKRRGFTLIELIIVIAILAILIAIAVPRYQQSNLTAQATAHNANVRVLKNAAMLYTVDHPEATTISAQELSDYLEDGKIPTPAKALNTDTFTVDIVDGRVEVSPGMVEIQDGSMVVAGE